MAKLILGIMSGFANFTAEGVHPAAWLYPGSNFPDHLSFKARVRVAQKAEEGLFDFLFIADAPGIMPGSIDSLKRMNVLADYEPITLLSGLAAVTSHVGLAATVSTSFAEPYNVARQFASLDHMSDGRAAWNVVTSTIPSLGLNFGKQGQEDHAMRYRRAQEFLNVTLGLWDSWDDDAFARDVDKAEYFDPAKLHPLNHKGEFYSVAGPLNVPRPPQGRPVIIQAGGSEAGREFAARTAEVVFTLGNRVEVAKSFRDDLHKRMTSIGRPTDELKTVASLSMMLARTENEAKDRFAVLQSLLHPDVGRQILSFNMGNADLSGVPVDEPIPVELLPQDTNRGKTYLEAVRDIVSNGNPTLRQVYERFAPGWGGNFFVGTPMQMADMMESWFAEAAVDGFMLSPMTIPVDLDLFVAEVVPELQKRGLFRTSYEGRSLRENLGLRRPASRYAR
jgi:FMN-dependent oxidoreductase (nitrilotriacetate monooxygenase family)